MSDTQYAKFTTLLADAIKIKRASEMKSRSEIRINSSFQIKWRDWVEKEI